MPAYRKPPAAKTPLSVDRVEPIQNSNRPLAIGTPGHGTEPHFRVVRRECRHTDFFKQPFQADAALRRHLVEALADVVGQFQYHCCHREALQACGQPRKLAAAPSEFPKRGGEIKPIN